MTAGKKIAAFAAFAIAAALLVVVPGIAARQRAAVPPPPEQFELPELDGRPVFLNFYSDDCQVCNIIKPDIEKLEAEFGEKIQFAHIDANDPRSAALVEYFEVTGLPSLFWATADGNVVDAQTGMINAQALRNSFEKVLFQRGAMPPSGMPPSGMPPSGMPPSGMPPSGMPPSGMPPSGN